MSETKRVKCPACDAPQVVKDDAGRPIAIEDIPKKMSFECPKCETKWTLTFDTGQEAMARAYWLAEDREG